MELGEELSRERMIGATGVAGREGGRRGYCSKQILCSSVWVAVDNKHVATGLFKGCRFDR